MEKRRLVRLVQIANQYRMSDTLGPIPESRRGYTVLKSAAVEKGLHFLFQNLCLKDDDESATRQSISQRLRRIVIEERKEIFF